MDIPVPASDLTIEIERLDEAWFELTPVSFRRLHPQWQDAYPELYSRYIEDILGLGDVRDTGLFRQILRFTSDQTIREVQQTTLQAYPNLDALESAFEDAWKYYEYYFPDRTIPKHVSMITGFNTPAILTSEGVGIGLEMFLGSQCPYYDYLQIPVYLRGRMTPAHIAPTIMKGWLESEFPINSENTTLLQEIVYQGKILYAMDALFPEMEDSLKIGYGAQGIRWARDHERSVWAHFIDKELLFSTNKTEIAKFLNDGPFTVDLVKESPARIGAFIGWMLVRSYMQQKTSIDLTALMAKDAEQLLNESKYKP